MATLSNNDIARSIYSFLKEKKGNEKESSKSIVQFLYNKRLFSKSKDILLRLEKIMNQDQGVVKAKISSTDKLKEGDKTKISKFLKQRYGAQEIVFNEVFDKELLGGVKIEVNDEVMDLTLKNKVEKLQTYLTRTI